MLPPQNDEKEMQLVPTCNIAAVTIAYKSEASSYASLSLTKIPVAAGGGGVASGGLGDRLLLSQLHEGAQLPMFKPSDLASLEGQHADDRPNPFGRIPVTRVEENARPLTAEEYRMFGPV
jgi:hypothetical protein